MLILKKVAVTGGLSSGKTSVCQILKELGAYVVSADEIVHQLLSPKSPLGQKITELLGQEIVIGSQFDRDKIAKEIFNNKKTLTSLERILHPAVLEEIERKFNHVETEHHPLFVAEIPLLYEIEAQDRFDKVIAVVADEPLCRRRFHEKTHKPSEEFEKRMTHQLSSLKKQALADHVIYNNGTLAELKQNVWQLFQNLTK